MSKQHLIPYVGGVQQRPKKKKGAPAAVLCDFSDLVTEMYRDNIRMAEELAFFHAKYGEQDVIEGEAFEVRDDEGGKRE